VFLRIIDASGLGSVYDDDIILSSLLILYQFIRSTRDKTRTRVIVVASYIPKRNLHHAGSLLKNFIGRRRLVTLKFAPSFEELSNHSSIELATHFVPSSTTFVHPV